MYLCVCACVNVCLNACISPCTQNTCLMGHDTTHKDTIHMKTSTLYRKTKFAWTHYTWTFIPAHLHIYTKARTEREREGGRERGRERERERERDAHTSMPTSMHNGINRHKTETQTVSGTTRYLNSRHEHALQYAQVAHTRHVSAKHARAYPHPCTLIETLSVSGYIAAM